MSPVTDPAPRAATPLVRFDEVHVAFTNGLRAPVHALRGFNMEIAPGAVVGLLGPNGSGKTTAISCLLGLLRPQAGVVELAGAPVIADLPAAPSLRVGVLLEDTRLPPFLSVRGALATVGRLRGFHAEALTKEMDRVIAESGVEAILERRVNVLSKGQSRRVGLATALVSDPPLLILDEPSAGLDVDAREEFNEIARGLRRQGRTVLIASHLLSDIESTCSHIAIVQAGKVRLYASAHELLRDARQQHSEKDYYVDDSSVIELARLGIRYEESRYPGLVRLAFEEPESVLLGRLAAAGLAPARVEPRVNLTSVYLEATANPRQ